MPLTQLENCHLGTLSEVEFCPMSAVKPFILNYVIPAVKNPAAHCGISRDSTHKKSFNLA